MTTELDRTIFLALFGGEQPGLALHLMVALTVIGRGYILWAIAALALVPARWMRPFPRFTPRAQRIAREMLMVLITVTILVYVGKAIVQRPRPYLELHLIPLGGHAPRDFSFPSGHAAGAFGFASFLCARLRPRASVATALLLFAFGIGLSRIYLGAHFPTDVLAGALLGSTAGGIAGHRLRAREATELERAQLAKPPLGEA